MTPSAYLANYPEPPTDAAVADARRELQSQQEQLLALSEKIAYAEDALAQIMVERKRAIRDLRREKLLLEEKVTYTKAYISPIRRLPHELLRHIFLFNFDDHPCCAWVLASVCTLWRRLTLSMPRLWSKIRLVTNQSATADTIRLWLERSGDKVPLDIEIYLRVNGVSNEGSSNRTRPASPTPWLHPPSPPPHYVIPHPPGTAMLLPPAHTPIIVPQSPSHHDSWGSPPPPSSRNTPQAQRNAHWGHIAIFYLIEQMHRWQRFVFRFDRQFPSMSALKSIAGDAPILREFEISCAETIYASEWPWIPSSSPATSMSLGKLESLMLHHVPFKWSSPIFKTNLRSLNLRSLPSNHLPLDRIMHIIASNPDLESLTLHFAVALPAILPLVQTSLSRLRELTFGGHYHMSQLADSLVLPSLEILNLDVEARDPIEDTITNLLQRSNNPPITRLSVSYGSTSSSTLYYGPGGVVISWGFLTDLNHLQSLSIGGTPLEPFLSALGMPDEEQTHWACPNLTTVAMKSCHAHSDGIAKLVQLVEARNPESGSATMVNGVIPTRLQHLELYDCATLGQDVIEWLKKRVDEVICTEPSSYVRSP
ncbi:uncharacterized protein EDB93DRAFT_1275807 [Suillus bovinus]|uniref:uncharacterized protein n=1 Tax=Suillus bovinus TaxID=48563 RepID=UPI001B877DA6|nr:uncharacterized protein EDB93DRAFT_1275807 [Suillus bovinus]KAG2151140.1 hypothetical protein EDB93DRAFT_1275807 [Suillus bovinus]